MVDRTQPLLVGGAVAAGVATFLGWRPAMLRWGTEGDEAIEPLPGDDLVPNPSFQSTRAITIDASPERVWPWIVQMGIYRGGFYTHDRIERALFHARYVEGKHSATRIHPELQDLKVGDLVPYGGGVYARVTQLEPNRCLVAGEAFVLRPLAGNRTRLIIRYRGMGYIGAAVEGLAADAPAVTKVLAFAVRHVPGGMLLARGVDLFIGDPLHHYMEVGVLRGTKKRAEGTYVDVGESSGTTSAAVEPMATTTDAAVTEVPAGRTHRQARGDGCRGRWWGKPGLRRPS